MTATSPQSFSSPGLPSKFGNFDLIRTEKLGLADIVVSKYRSRETGLTVVHLDYEAPLVNGYFVVATEIFNDSGCPHTLEHLVFMGSEKYPYKGIIDHFANRGFSNGTNAWTDTDHTAYTVSTAGEQGFLQILPIYIDHILYATITDAGFITEVHHIDPKGEDSGVVYSEMQGRENGSGDIMALKMQRLLNPPDSAYRSETGGLMEALRSLTVEQIRDYHKQYYVPHNLSLIITGKMSKGTPSILSVLQDQVEPNIVAHQQNRGPRPVGWKRPFLETPSAHRPPIARSRQETVTFPEKDESLGELIISYLGPPPSEFLERKALDILSAYLTSSPVAPLNKEYVEVENPLCTYIFFYEDERATRGDLAIYVGSVPVEHLPSLPDRLRASLARIAEEGLDMERMAMVLNRDERQLRSRIESSKGDAFSTIIITDFLYGKEDGSELRQALNEIDDYEILRKWSSKQWADLLKKYYVDPPSIVVCGQPSAAMAEKLEKDEKARIAAQVKKLGPEGLEAAAKLLEKAKAQHDKPIPDDIIKAFPVPDVKSISWIPVQSAHEKGKGKANFAKDSKLRKHIEGDGDPLPFFIGFDHVQSDFVTVSMYVSMSAIPNHLRPHMSTYVASFFSLPVKRSTGECLSHEEVVNKLDDETVAYGAELGTGSAFEELLRVSIKVEKDRYETAVSWLKDLFYGSEFDKERLQITVAKIHQSLPEMKRSGKTVLSAIASEQLYDETSTPRAGTVLKQAEFIPELVQQLQSEPKKVTEEFELIRRTLTRPEGIRFSVTGNILDIQNPKKPWREHFGNLNQTILQPVPFSDKTLSAAGKKPATKALVVSLSTIESSFVYHTSRGVQGFDHPDLPALRITLSMMNATESYLWRYIRGSGLAYGAYISNDTEAGLLTFSLYRSSSYIAAYEQAAKVVQGLVDGSIALDDITLDAAKSSIVFDVAQSVSTPGSAALTSFLNQGLKGLSPNHNVELLGKYQAVKKEDVMRCLKEYILKLFQPDSSIALVVTAPGKSDEIVEKLGEKGFKVERRTIEVRDEEGDSDGSSSDSEGSERNIVGFHTHLLVVPFLFGAILPYLNLIRPGDRFTIELCRLPPPRYYWMSRNEYTLGLISKVRDQARALSAHPIPWPKDSVVSLYNVLQACALSTRLDINNSLPVNKLPHEVLSHVFELACSPPSAATMAFKVVLTHVCRYWRGILLSYPKIWTNIFARRDNSDFFSECLLRSRTFPIHLNLHYHVGWDSPSGCSCEDPSLVSRRVRCPHIRARKTTELFEEHGPRGRLRSLDLLIFFSDLATEGLTELKHISFFNRPLPELETLRLVCLDAAQSSEEFIIYGNIFSGSLPRLKHLSLVHCWGGLTSWVIGLTSFHLEFRHSWDVQSAEFITFLEHNSRTLEVLSLDNIGFTNAGGRSVTLTNLRELKLKRVPDPVNLFLHLTLPMFENLTMLRVRFSDVMATFSATNDAGAALQVIESQGDIFSCCTNGLASHLWTQISTLDLELQGLQEVPELDVEDLYRSIPSLEIVETRTVSHLRQILRPLLPTKQVLHPSLKLLRLPISREVQDEVFITLTTVTHARKAMGCVVWDIECICDENCEEIFDQWAAHCEKDGFGNPEIVKFTMDPEYLNRQSKVSEGRPARTTSVPGASISKDPNREVRERVLAVGENLSSQAKELIKLSETYYSRENLSRIALHINDMRIGIGRIHNETSPVYKLPRGLLQVVFYHACWSGQQVASRSAVTLSHVCYQWRAILLSTPQFWCGVTVDGRDPSYPAACLSRSGNLPLDVTVQFNYTTPPYDPHVGFCTSVLEDEDVRQRSDECREGLALLESERGRIHRLYVNYILLGPECFQDEIMNHDFFKYSLKNLQALRWNYDDKQGILSLPPQIFGGSLESLRCIRLENTEPSTRRFPNLTSLECIRVYDTDCVTFMGGRIPEFFSRNASLRSLDILEFHIYEGDFPRISMDNLTSLTLSRVFRWYLLFGFLDMRNLDGGTFSTISFSNQRAWIAFSAVNSIGFSLTASISPYNDPGEDDFIRRYFSRATLIRLEDFQMIHNTERLFSILRIFGNSEGDIGRLELRVETGPLALYPQVTVFAKPLLPRLRTLAIYLRDWGGPWGWEWVGVMTEDLFDSKHRARFPDEFTVTVYCSNSSIFLSANMGELRAEFEARRPYDYLISSS